MSHHTTIYRYVKAAPRRQPAYKGTPSRLLSVHTTEDGTIPIKLARHRFTRALEHALAQPQCERGFSQTIDGNIIKMDKQIVHEEKVHGYSYHRLIRIVKTKEKYSHAGARAKHYCSAGRVDDEHPRVQSVQK